MINELPVFEMLAAALLVSQVVIGTLVVALLRQRRRHRACRHELGRVAREKHALQMRLCADPGQAGDAMRARILDACMVAMARQ